MPRFVLLEHVWNGVHWDFMLEDGDVLRTWAIDAPIVAGQDLPARALADHRRIYLEYEGEISGNRGCVRRVDAGTYRTLVWSADRVRVELAGSQLVGEVDLRASGVCVGRDRRRGSSAWEISTEAPCGTAGWAGGTPLSPDPSGRRAGSGRGGSEVPRVARPLARDSAYNA